MDMARSLRLGFIAAFALFGSACAHGQARGDDLSEAVEPAEVFTRVQHRANGEMRRFVMESESFDGECVQLDREVYRYDRRGGVSKVRKERRNCGVPVVRSDYQCSEDNCVLDRSIDSNVDGRPDRIVHREGVDVPAGPAFDSATARSAGPREVN